VWLLRSLLNDRTRSRKPVFVTFIDVDKAFDSVSHQSLIIAARRVGVPDIVLEYIASLYTGTTMRIKVGKLLSDKIHVQRGVRQGDPLSPLLFDYIMDWVLDNLDPELGIGLEGGPRLNHLAFANDVSLVSESRRGALRLANRFEEGLSEVGLIPNAKKSATLAVQVDGKKKKWFVDSYAVLASKRRACSSYAYHGCLSLSWYRGGDQSATAESSGETREGIEELTRAPLKPQQRMYMLRVHLIPSLIHQLVLDRVTISLLKWLDRISREAVRTWLRLPHDVPMAMCLGVPLLATKVRVMRRNRMRRLCQRAQSNMDNVLAWFVNNSPTMKAEADRWDTHLSWGYREFYGRG